MKKILPIIVFAGFSAACSQAATYVFNGGGFTFLNDNVDHLGHNIFNIDKGYDKGQVTWGSGDDPDNYGKDNATYYFGLDQFTTGGGDWNLNRNHRLSNKFSGILLTGVTETELSDYASSLYSFTASLDGEYAVVTRWLFSGSDIWYRDGDNAPDYTNSTEWTASDGSALTRYLNPSPGSDPQGQYFFTTTDTGLTASAADVGKYALVVTGAQGIGIQYVTKLNTIPEPSAATFGLFSLLGLAAFRRRTA